MDLRLSSKRIVVIALAVGATLAVLTVISIFYWVLELNPPEVVTVFDAGLKPKPELQKVTMLAVGDIMLSRHVGEKMFEAKDYTLPFSKTASLLAAADITIGNLESPFYDQGRRLSEGMVFKAEPEAMAGLKLAGFDVLTLANNHTLNQGVVGLNYTLDYSKKNNIQIVGAGQDFTLAHQGAVVKAKNTTFGFLGYSYEGYHDELGQKNVVCSLDLEQAKKDIEELKKQVGVVVVMMHAGTEYTNLPNKVQKDFAHSLVEAGADLVIGHHPHWPQIVENYQGKWIFYSLGNFVFDQEWSQETKEGLILSVAWQAGELTELKLLPVVIENYSTPRLANSQESAVILGKIKLTDPVIFTKKLDSK